MVQRVFARCVSLTALFGIAACSDQSTAPLADRSAPAKPSYGVGSHLGTGVSVVYPGDMHGWYFWNDKNDTFAGSPGELVIGPGAPPMGAGSVRLGPLTDDGSTAAGHAVIATNEFNGTRLANITALSYSTSQTGPTTAIALQFDVRYRPTDVSYGGRLIFEPYQTFGTVGSGWQSWTPLSGKWWASKTTVAGTGGAQVVALPAGNCSQATPCTWSEIKAAFPDAVIAGRLLLKAGSNWNGFDGHADALTVGVSGVNAVFDFEASAPGCTSTCYVDAASGNDASSGITAASAKKTIQAALNSVSPNGTVRVLPGTYDETAPGSVPASMGSVAVYQFGLFFAAHKPGITLMGVTAGDAPILSAAAAVAQINTNATNNFGESGIFVEAANTTIQGLKIGPNIPGDNKTIEVVADNFTLQYVTTVVPDGGGSIYISEFDAPAGAVSSYHIKNNRFTDATQVAISSGAGKAGAVANREIVNNVFDLGGNSWPGISFNGAGGVPWYTKPVGGAIITGNSFVGGSDSYIRSRGTVTEAEFSWSAYWSGNTYDKATIALSNEPSFIPRAYSYVSGSYTLTNVRRIGSTIQGEVNKALAADVVLAKAGTYPEDVVVSLASIQLKGAGVDQSIIVGTKGDATFNTLELSAGATGATVDGFTITRAGNNVADWNDANGALNNQGVAINANGAQLKRSKVTGNRNGVFLYSAKNVVITENVIDNNRTGVHTVNDVTGLMMKNNFITNNWTMGVLFRDETGGVNSTGAVTIQDNHIAGNWFSQIEARSNFTAPAFDLTKNWLGTTSPSVVLGVDGQSASGEPGYSGQIPVQYGGASVATAASATIAYNSINVPNPITYIPFRCNGTDASSAIGYQPTADLSGASGSCDKQGPITTLTAPAPVPINTAVSVPVSISDLTTGNSKLKSYTWTRDGGAATTVNFAAPASVTKSFSQSIAADVAADVDKICVKSTDEWDNVGPEVCVLAVWYDPNAGFVTGGGWINSPAGAYVADNQAAGRANFGFVSKYTKGKTTPTGNTEFQFSAGSLSLSSTALDWLVVSGTKAQFRGTGTINGSGAYDFTLTVIDGDSGPGNGNSSGPDKFRIRIWNRVTGGLVYDNQMNAPDDADPTTVIGGGSIVIHK